MIDPKSGTSPFGGTDFASTFAQVAGAVSTSFQYDQEVKKAKIKEMLDQAKQFGMPGIRKLYADPNFIGMARSLNINLSELPPESAEELTASRSRELLTELDRRMKSGEDPNIVRQDLGKRYPGEAKTLGVSIEPTASTTNAMINALAKNVDPGQFMAILGLVYPNGIPPGAEQSAISLTMSQKVQDSAQAMRDRHTLMIQQAGLTGAKAKEINTLLDAKLVKLNADIALIREGKIPLAQAQTLLESYKADVEKDFGKALAAAKVTSLTSGARLNDARAFHTTQLGKIKQLEAESDRAFGLFGGPKSVTLYTKKLGEIVRAEQAEFNRLNVERDKLSDQLSSGGMTKEEFDTLKTQYDSDIKELRDKLRADMKEWDTVLHGGASNRLNPGADSKPTFTDYKYPTDWKGPKIQAKEIYDQIISKYQPEQWFQMWQSARKNPALAGVPTEVWHQVDIAIMAEFKRLRPNLKFGPQS